MALPKFDLRQISKRVKNLLIYDEEIINKRWDLCKDCEFLLPTNNCKKCGCFMVIKSRISTSRCPIGKWEKEYEFIKGKKVNVTQPTS